jgi:hypothetical protein
LVPDTDEPAPEVKAGIPEVRFEAELAFRIFPRPLVKQAILVRIPLTEDGDLIPHFIKPDFGGIQVFYGDFYLLYRDGESTYGSAKDQWELMHTLLSPGNWVKTSIPTAYLASEVCRIVTLIPSDDGGIKESNIVLDPGDWVVRQPGGEVQHIRAAKFGNYYFSQDEAEQLGLTGMTQEQFAEWALAQVRKPADV